MDNLIEGITSLPQGLVNLPDELILIIFDYIQKITDKRQFLKTCVHYNKITKKSLINFENDMVVIYFQKLFNCRRDVMLSYNFDNKFKHFRNIFVNKFRPEKFIIELSHDGYSNLISKLYLNLFDNDSLIPIFATYNNVELLEYVINKNSKTELISSYGARNGHISVLEFCKNKNYTLDYRICYGAAGNGHIDVLKWYIRNGYGWNSRISKFAAYCGNVDILKLIINSNLKLFFQQILECAASYGHVNILEFGVEKECKFNIEICKLAARYGNLNVLKWLKQNKYECDADECIISALYGIENINKWAKEYGNEQESQDYINKKLQNQDDVIAWVKNGCLI